MEFLTAEIRRAGRTEVEFSFGSVAERKSLSQNYETWNRQQFCLARWLRLHSLFFKMFTIFRATQQDFLQRTYYNDLLTHNHPVTQARVQRDCL